jgi:hypothetical protein
MGVKATFFPKFKKVIALTGSDRDGERHAAADQAYRMCEENDLSFLEALEGAFGSANDEELLRQISELEDDNRKLADAVNVLNAQRQAVPENAGRELLIKAWSYPQVRLAVLLVATGLSFWLVDGFHRWAAGGNRFIASVAPFIKWATVIDVAMLVWEWACAEFSKSGIGVVAVKGALIFGGLYISFAVFSRSHDLTGAAILLSVAGALTISNVCRWLAREMAHSNREAFRLLRSWFA